MSFRDVFEKTIDKKIKGYEKALEYPENDILDEAFYKCSIRVLEDLRDELIP